jgi:CTP synthase
MTTKYIFILGGVVSGLGKGITAASLGRLLKSRGLKVIMQKLDPYLNMDPGTMNPLQHGEVFVTEDGAETDLDIGHYERFTDENQNKHANYTSGKIYHSVLENERNGSYGGATVQMIPHVTNYIKDIIRINAKTNHADVAIVEIGGTVGDIESLPHIEAIRQFQIEEGYNNCMYIHVPLVPVLTPSDELKTKPAQHSVKELLSLGIQPDILVCRTERNLGKDIRKKLALFCNVPIERVIQNKNLPSLYEIPLALEEEGLAEEVIERLKIKCKEKDLSDWIEMLKKSKHTTKSVTIGLIGEYTELHDAYISIVEALKHAAIFNFAKMEIKWINSDEVTEKNANTLFSNINGILISGSLGDNGIEGKAIATRFALKNNIPFFGICLGLQIAVNEIVQNVETWHTTSLPVRLGKYPCKLMKGTKAFDCYKEKLISERHRHSYEVSNEDKDKLRKNGVIISGTSPDGMLVEVIELQNHSWFVACQFQPEFKSRPNRPHPLFMGFVKAAINS